ncbi:stromal interaction molecule homolog isoform X1 [Branchiostoma floridae]|uniref:Stromal interaction molecule homolog isoform X1 n=1 Tax=Branchiostoma floridae TaxID=7739 RepID=A0A9J7LE92_BRAFL|nr:stromal interaction molecule homolog isoform X1 [Branchiostoma floridae]
MRPVLVAIAMIVLLAVSCVHSRDVSLDEEEQCTDECRQEKDRLGLEALHTLHRMLDDDHNGNVDLSESDEFLRDELHYQDGSERQSTFHRSGEDKFISVDDLWTAWKHSEVYNWTVEHTVAWLVNAVELPQYAATFETNAVDGSALPRLALDLVPMRLAVNNPHFLTTILGITNPVHRQKIALKAMDVVLFGPAKQGHSYIKDTALVLSLVIAIGGCWFAFVQHRFSQGHIKKMMREMESLQKAEETLGEMQARLQQAEEEQQTVVEEKMNLEAKMREEMTNAKQEAERLKMVRENTETEINRLRIAEEELYQVRQALRKAEKELERRSWHPPTSLQQWLQLTYELELKNYSNKRLAAETQFAEAKESCEKIRKKRITVMGALKIAHTSSLDEVDKRIAKARSALQEVTSDLKERLVRWRKIEKLCGFNIITNPGLTALSQVLTEGSVPGSPGFAGSVQGVEDDSLDEDQPPTYSTGSSGAMSSSHSTASLSTLGEAMMRPGGGAEPLAPTFSIGESDLCLDSYIQLMTSQMYGSSETVVRRTLDRAQSEQASPQRPPMVKQVTSQSLPGTLVSQSSIQSIQDDLARSRTNGTDSNLSNYEPNFTDSSSAETLEEDGAGSQANLSDNASTKTAIQRPAMLQPMLSTTSQSSLDSPKDTKKGKKTWFRKADRGSTSGPASPTFEDSTDELIEKEATEDKKKKKGKFSALISKAKTA